jgi:hypothetical protein
MTIEIAAVSRPIVSDFCSPRIDWAKTSSPIWLVPNQWLGEGPCRNAV